MRIGQAVDVSSYEWDKLGVGQVVDEARCGWVSCGSGKSGVRQVLDGAKCGWDKMWMRQDVFETSCACGEQ